MSLLGLQPDPPTLAPAVYSSSARPIDHSYASVRLLSHMEERDRPSSSRKRHRSDEISGSSFRLPESSGIAVSNTSRMRTVGNTHSSENDPNMPVSSEAQAPALEPLHPPIPSIPNFSAISQGISRPMSLPSTGPETPGGVIYNIGLPLPNPGRAHRFCQACDHVNHVRRKLCTNCGAPKPSAVRNAVGVRSISEVDSSAERRPQGEGMSGYLPSQIPSSSVTPGGQYDVQNRLNSQGFTQGDPRFQRQPEHVSYQARSLAMRSPGDDIPLLGNTQRLPHSTFPAPDSQTSRRMRGGQVVLGEPLINFNTFGAQDNRNVVPPTRQPYGNPIEFQEKAYSNPSTDRDHFTIPPTSGIPSQKVIPNNSTNHRIPPGPIPIDNRGSRNISQVTEGAIPEDVLSLNRNNLAQNMDSRQGIRRYQNVHGLRQFSGDQGQTQIYPSPETTGLLYRQGQEFFQPQAQFRADDRGQQILSQFPPRNQKLVQSLGASPSGEDRGFPSHQIDIQRGQGLTNLVEQQSHPHLRRGIEDDRSRHLSLDGRSQNLRHLQKNDEQVNVNAGHFDDSNRHPDDGRLTLDNLLMQHKNTGHTD